MPFNDVLAGRSETRAFRIQELAGREEKGFPHPMFTLGHVSNVGGEASRVPTSGTDKGALLGTDPAEKDNARKQLSASGR